MNIRSIWGRIFHEYFVGDKVRCTAQWVWRNEEGTIAVKHWFNGSRGVKPGYYYLMRIKESSFLKFPPHSEYHWYEYGKNLVGLFKYEDLELIE